jgi:hypothetical protein
MIGRLTLAKLIFSAIDFFGNDDHLDNYVFTFQDGRPPHRDTIRERSDRLAAAAGRRVAISQRNGRN